MAEPHRCLAVVGTAYLIQGIVAGLGLMLLGVLAQLGVSLETQVGILASGAVPWLIKFAVAAALDLGPSWRLRTRGLALFGLQAGVALSLWSVARAWPAVAAAPADAEAATSLGLAWVAVNACAALQDVLVDGLALDTLRDHRASTGALMGLGHVLGTGLGAELINHRITSAGMVAGLGLPAIWVAVLACAPAPLLWLSTRPTLARERVEPLRERSGRELGTGAWLLISFALLLFGAAATQAVGAEFLFGELGWDRDRYARLPMIAAVVGVVGSLGCGPLVARLGPTRAAMAAGAALGLVWLGFAGLRPWWPHDATILGLACVEGTIQPALLVALHALALAAAARSPAPTTTFVLAMAALNLPRVLAPLAAPSMMVLGFAGLFATCGLIQLVASAGLWPLRTLEIKSG